MTAKEWKQIGITAVGDIKLIEQEAMKFANWTRREEKK
jgi:hypothetical protein